MLPSLEEDAAEAEPPWRRKKLLAMLGTNPIKSEVILSKAVMYAARMIVGTAESDQEDRD